jgi:hypothetical protein
MGIDVTAERLRWDRRGAAVAARVKQLHKKRDTQSAHGGRTAAHRNLTYYDLAEIQWILSECIAEVLVHRSSKPGTQR